MSIETPAARRRQRIAQLYNDDHQARAAAPDEAVLDAVRTPGIGVAQIVTSVLTGYAERPALGQRAFEIVRGPGTGHHERRWLDHFDTITYAEVADRVEAVAAAWRGRAGVEPGAMVALLGVTGVELTIVDLTCARLGAVVVPLQAGAPGPTLAQIVAETEPRVLVSTPELLDRAVDCALACPALRQLVVIDHVAEVDAHRSALAAAAERLAGTSITLETLAEVIEAGRDMPRPAPYFTEPGTDPLAMLIYTSGSTGTPKGAMYTDRLAAGIWLQGLARKAGSNPPAISVNYMPLSHLAGRLALAGVLVRGGTAYFTAAADMSTLFDDIALVRPTEMVLVPRVSEMIYQRYQSELAGGRTDEQARAQLRRELLGGRLISASTGSAPLAPELKTFMESLLEIEVHDAYGSTEAGGGLVVDNRVRRPVVIDYKLVDVPELGYHTTDAPYPRGELLLKTTTMIPGYYRRPDITAQVFDADGFYRTGDIVAEIGPDRLRYLDRRNNVLKLSQGEFVAVAQLEAVFAGSPLIRQIFVYGSSVRAYLLAVVVPTEAALAAAADTGELTTSIAASVRAVAAEAGLEPYEIPREFIVETEPFTIENGLLSGIGKLLRPALERRYGPRLEQMYRDRAEGRSAQLLALRAGAGEAPVAETVVRAARAVLDCTAEQSSPQAHFADLGGDSLSALSLANLLTEIFGVEVPVSVVTSPATTLGDLAEYVVTAQESGTGVVSFAGVHGAAPDQVAAADLRLEKFVDAETLAAAPGLPVAATTSTVLITGANGYLGRWLCLRWLERMAAVGGRVLCVVRGKDIDSARRRLEAAFDSGDPELLRRYRELARDHLEVIAGDISAPRLGLGEAAWQELARRVDRIVHCAALVNHVLPYAQLFGPNVVGTAEMIRLALTHRLKPVTYLSTVAVAADVDRTVFTEGGDIRAGSPVRGNGAGYATGYGNSKWAGEVLLREAHDLCGLPVAVFRSDMVLAHPHYRGQLNVPDMFTRLLIGLAATGVAPASFYRGGRGARAHYDGLPADFTAEAITVLGGAVDGGHHSFHVLNPHDDGISLDTVVDWLIAAGVAIERVDDYAEWLARFEAALRALPEPQRSASVLPLLHAFARPAPAIAGSAIPATEFRAAVRAAELGADADIPHLSAELITKYVGDLRLHGLIA
ncbi:carboxylic acid reductase [Nocardia cyriacigeorgica]|uniref:carboxylic acid reductase n=1 Tax=Nocardia cyriacigeorgica TaxID=135487 RepID=UPI001893FAD4|nr:carboxylic acid reductase [Nocardia cyriacigeorgica]MBF6413996.1 thioester reductase domain-containing protein [Nocardia cyriacigeorgica]